MYLNDDVNNFTSYQEFHFVTDYFKSFIDAKLISKLHVDQEPNKPEMYEFLYHMLATAQSTTNISSTLKPLWLNERISDIWNKFSPAFRKLLEERQVLLNKTYEFSAELFIECCSETQLMAYSNNFTIVSGYLDKYQELLSKWGKPGQPIVETGFINSLAEDQTLHYEFQTRF